MILATYNDKTLVVDILCESFDKNKSVNYVVKQDRRRAQRIKSLMEYSFDMCYLFGKILLSDDKNACALMQFPDKKKNTFKTTLLDAKLAMSSIGLSRVSKVQGRDSKIKSAYPKQQEIIYLWFLGVKASQQKKGLGKLLLKEIIKESEALKRPIYLETSTVENVGFYKKFGFDVYKELDFGHTLSLLKRNLQ